MNFNPLFSSVHACSGNRFRCIYQFHRTTEPLMHLHLILSRETKLALYSFQF